MPRFVLLLVLVCLALFGAGNRAEARVSAGQKTASGVFANPPPGHVGENEPQANEAHRVDAAVYGKTASGRGNFLSPDPFGHSSSMSLYDYANGDPVNRFDPDGRFGKDIHGNPYQDPTTVLGIHNILTGLQSMLGEGEMPIGMAQEDAAMAMALAYAMRASPGRADPANIADWLNSQRARLGYTDFVDQVYLNESNLQILINNNLRRPLNVGRIEAASAFGDALTFGALGAAQVPRVTGPTQNTVTLYRGVNSTNVAYADALAGVAKPNRSWWQIWKSPATPLEHNTVSTLNSPYTSWTTNPAVAENFALRTSGRGVILRTEVPASSVVTSPNLKNVVLIQNGRVVSESEVLLRGVQQGAATAVGR